MIRLVALAALACWVGLTLVLADLGWFARTPLTERLRPYLGGGGVDRTPAVLSVASLREIVGPVAVSAGARLARVFGVNEELSIRLTRIHAAVDVQGFRVRQLGWSALALVVTAATAIVAGLPAVVALAGLAAAPLLAFLITEQQVARASRDWQDRLSRELPVAAEQLGMLLGAGYSLRGALDRIALRSTGCIATDLAIVGQRIRQGLSDVDALREWAEIARVDGVDRLVGVLALNQEASDLSRLISEEARAIRRDHQRQLIEAIERRSQQVWIPVTVATLVPGALFLAVPFLEAMRFFTEG